MPLLRTRGLHYSFRCAESNGKLPHLFILSKTATLVPGFAVEELPLGRTEALVPDFAVKDLPLGRTLDDNDDDLPMLFACFHYFLNQGSEN